MFVLTPNHNNETVKTFHLKWVLFSLIIMFVEVQTAAKRLMRDGAETFQKSSHVAPFGCIRHMCVCELRQDRLSNNAMHR